MVWKPDDVPLTGLDWRVIGKTMRRIEVPMPNDRDGMHVLAHRLAGLSEQIHEAARTNFKTRSAIMEIGNLIYALNQDFKELARVWEPEREAACRKAAQGVGRKGNEAGTGECGEPEKLHNLVRLAK